MRVPSARARRPRCPKPEVNQTGAGGGGSLWRLTSRVHSTKLAAFPRRLEILALQHPERRSGCDLEDATIHVLCGLGKRSVAPAPCGAASWPSPQPAELASQQHRLADRSRRDRDALAPPKHPTRKSENLGVKQIAVEGILEIGDNARTCLREYNGERSSVLCNVIRRPVGLSGVIVYVSAVARFCRAAHCFAAFCHAASRSSLVWKHAGSASGKVDISEPDPH